MEKKHFLNGKRTITYHFRNKKFQDTVLFLHGAGSNMRQFEEHIDFFSESFNCLNVTLYGHDPSMPNEVFKSEDFNLNQLATDILSLLEYLKIHSIHIIGNSAGGLVGFEIIKSQQVNVLSLTTFGTSPKIKYPKKIVHMISKIDAYFLRKNPFKYLSFVAKASSNQEKTIKAITNIMMESKHAAPYIRSQIGRYDYIEVVENIAIPYLLLKGPLDKSINKSLKQHMKKFNNNLNIKVMEIYQSGHFINMDQPNEFNHIVKTFIQENTHNQSF